MVKHGPDRSVGPSSFWIGLKSVRSKSNLLSVRSDSISKNVGPRHWTGPDRDRTEVVHPWYLVVALELQDLDKIDFDELTARLLEEEKRILDEYPRRRTAMISRNQFRNKSECNYCHQIGHWK